MKRTTIPAVLGLAALLATAAIGAAQETGFFRIASTQATQITEFDREGVLAWSNAVDGATGRVDWTSSLASGWCTSAPAAQAVASGRTARARVSTTNDSLYVKGTIVHLTLEGGFYGIEGEDGQHYDPMNLPPAFCVPGKRVLVLARERKDAVSFHMWGRIIEILSIEPVE